MEQNTFVTPTPGRCPVCATQHPDSHPHDKDSLYYQFKFSAEWGRFPSWRDAMAHCSDEIRAEIGLLLSENGVSLDEC
jgi:hypothetical protein